MSLTLKQEIQTPGVQIGGAVFIALSILLGLSVGNMAAGVCFGLAAYAVVANDAVQTLMTFINSNRDVKWQWLYAGAAAVMVSALWWGWSQNGGDISYGRLDAKGYTGVSVEWYMVIFPLILIFLTKSRGVPVSTSLLMLSIFAGDLLFGQIVIKSFAGYLVAFLSAYVLWLMVEASLKTRPPTTTKPHNLWRVAQWGTTGLLWWTWLSHDMVNMAVFLPSPLSGFQLALITSIFLIGLAYTFWSQGGKIGNIVTKKTETDRVIAATLIDLVYFVVLLIFKEWNNIPMSTTWVFIGLMAGREFAIRTINRLDPLPADQRFKAAYRLVWKDASKVIFGLGVSVLALVVVRAIT